MYPQGPSYPPPYGQPPYGQPPYGGPPKKDRTVLIVLICVGIFAMLVGIPFTIGVVMGIRNASRARAAKVAGVATDLSEKYATTNGLLTIHYPSDFAAKKLDDSTIIVTRNLGGGADELVTFGAVSKPITDDPHELGRILLGVVSKNVESKGGTYTKTSETTTMCLGKYKGTEVGVTWKIPGSDPYTSKACFFMHSAHGYEFRYDVSAAHAVVEVPLIERIQSATEFKD